MKPSVTKRVNGSSTQTVRSAGSRFWSRLSTLAEVIRAGTRRWGKHIVTSASSLVHPRSFFPTTGIPPVPKTKPVYRIVAIPRGTIRTDGNAVVTETVRKVRCGSILRARDGRPYLVVERKVVGIVSPQLLQESR